MPRLTFTIMLVALCFVTKGQDRIFMKNGDTLYGKVLSVSPYSVDYRSTDSTDSLVHELSRTNLNYIVYKNGTSDTFRETDIQTATGPYIYKGTYYTSHRLSEMGLQDAKIHYKMKRGVGTIIALSSIAYPFYNLVSTIIIAKTKPKEKNLRYPYPELMLKEEYRNAYETKAWQMKRKQTWREYWIGTAIFAGVMVGTSVAVLLVSSHTH